MTSISGFFGFFFPKRFWGFFGDGDDFNFGVFWGPENPQKFLGIFMDMVNINFGYSRKFPLRGYIQGVLTHTTAWDRHWGGDETLKKVLINADQLRLAS